MILQGIKVIAHLLPAPEVAAWRPHTLFPADLQMTHTLSGLRAQHLFGTSGEGCSPLHASCQQLVPCASQLALPKLQDAALSPRLPDCNRLQLSHIVCRHVPLLCIDYLVISSCQAMDCSGNSEAKERKHPRLKRLYMGTDAPCFMCHVHLSV